MLNVDRRAQRKLFFLCAFCFLVLCATVFATANPVFAQDQQPPTPPPFDPAAVPPPSQSPLTVLGMQAFSENCAPCHGETGNSDGPVVANLTAPPPKFSDPATIWGKSPAEYFHTIKYGRIQNLMPPWGNRLSDDEIWLAAYYAWSLHTSETTVAQGRTLYDANCASCHGPEGKGDGAQAPVDLVDFSDSAAMIVRTQADLDAGWRKAHGDLGADWSAEDRLATLDAIRTFSYSPPWVTTVPPGEGVISGTVYQGTAGGDVLTATTVALTGYINFSPAFTATTQSDESGRFTFTQLSLVSGIQYVVDTVYKSLNYSSFTPPISVITPTASVELAVYETTDNADALHLQRASLVVDFEPGAVLIGDVSDLFNQGDRTYVGRAVEGVSNLATLEINLQPGAEEIRFQDGVLGGRYQQVGNKIFDTVAIPPGERVAFVSYRLPTEGTSFALTPTFAYPVGQMNLLVADLPGIKVDAPGLTQQSVEDIQGRSYQLWVGTAPAAGLQVKIDGILEAGSVDPRDAAQTQEAAVTDNVSESTVDPRIAFGLAGVLAAVLLGVLIYPLRKQPSSPLEAMRREQEELLKRIAEIDDLHAIEQIDTAAWQQQRAQYKGRLLDVTQELRAKEGEVAKK